MRFFKTTGLLLALGALLLVPVAAAEQGAEHDTLLNNASTELKVKMRLLEKIGWDMMSSNVEAEGGTVMLLGTVNSDANRELATEVARSVDGVSTVINKLRVKKSEQQAEAKKAAPVAERVAEGEREVRDAVLESRVKTALIGEIGLNAFDVEVEATDGEVSLRGTLDNKEHKRLAMQTAEGTSGVDRVIDLLDVR